MSDEINVEELKAAMEEKPEQQEVEAAPEFTEVEQEAIKHGWKAEGVEGKANLSAEEFMSRQPIYDEMRSLKRANKRLQEGQEALLKHNRNIQVKERARAKEELKAAKAEAMSEQDFEAVVAIDEKMAEVAAEEQADAEVPAVNTDFEQWVDDNRWYGENQEMKVFADSIGQGYATNNPNKPLSEVYEYVTQEVTARYPNYFGNTQRTQPSPVEGASKGRATTSKHYSAKDLPEEDRRMMRTILRTTDMSEEEYLEQYFG